MLQRMETDRLASSLSTNVEEQSQLSSSLMRKMKEPAVASGGGFAPVLESPEQAVTQSKDAALGTMIARNISLSVIVKDFAFSRTALDAILARHNGYSAQLNVNTPEGSARTLQASRFVASLMGGISDGGAAGSKVRFAKLAGCFSIAGSDAAVSPPGEKRPHPAEPSTSVPRVTQSRLDKRQGKAVSAFHCPKNTPPGL